MFLFWHLEGTGLRGIDKGGLYFVRVEGDIDKNMT
jgi:hypothetical protein